MWHNTITLEEKNLTEFEKKFQFRMNPEFREFLLTHNAGYPLPGTFTTTKKVRKMKQFLDFNDVESDEGAFEVNLRLRNKIGPKRIIVGIDQTGNFICLERNYARQYIVVWSHITGAFERCILDLPMFMRQIG